MDTLNALVQNADKLTPQQQESLANLRNGSTAELAHSMHLAQRDLDKARDSRNAVVEILQRTRKALMDAAEELRENGMNVRNEARFILQVARDRATAHVQEAELYLTLACVAYAEKVADESLTGGPGLRAEAGTFNPLDSAVRDIVQHARQNHPEQFQG